MSYFGASSGVYSLEYINNDLIASGGYDNYINIWNTFSGSSINLLNNTESIFSLKFLPNRNWLISACETIRIYDMTKLSLVATLTNHSSYVTDLVLINDTFLASSSFDKTIIIWNLTLPISITHVLYGHDFGVNSLTLVSPTVLASGSDDNTIKIWDLPNGKLLTTLYSHIDSIICLDMLMGNILISGSNTVIKYWNVSNWELIKTINSFSKISSLAVF